MKKEFLYSFEWFFKELESINLLHTRQVEKKVTIYSRWPYSHKRKYFIQENIPELQCSDKHHLQQESGISNKTIKYKLNIKYSNSNLSLLVEYFVEWCWISWLMYRVKFWILPTHHLAICLGDCNICYKKELSIPLVPSHDWHLCNHHHHLQITGPWSSQLQCKFNLSPLESGMSPKRN